MFEKEDLLKIARMPMPFGKHAGQLLIELPEPYLVWFSQQGFPDGKLGELLSITLEIKTNGLTYLITPLKKPTQEKTDEAPRKVDYL